MHGDQHPAVVNALLGLGKIALWSDDMHGAETYFQEALDTALDTEKTDRLAAIAYARAETERKARARIGWQRRARGSARLPVGYAPGSAAWVNSGPAIGSRVRLAGRHRPQRAVVVSLGPCLTQLGCA